MAFQITRLATTAPYKTKTVEEIGEMIRRINKIVRGLKSREVKIAHGGFWPTKRPISTEEFPRLKIFGFSDAGFGSLLNYKSVETGVITIGMEMGRGGSISIKGSVAEAYTRKISRCVRSTIAAEGTAVSNLIEGAFWAQSYLCEMALGEILRYSNP